MNNMTFFIENFVQKRRRERWLYLLSLGWKKFFDNIGQMENHLNERCAYFRPNGADQAQEIILDEGIKKGAYYDWFRGSEDRDHEFSLRDLSQIELHDHSFIICQKHRMAFYFDNEYGVWVCRV